jgi:hypothetical protein
MSIFFHFAFSILHFSFYILVSPLAHHGPASIRISAAAERRPAVIGDPLTPAW